MHYSGLNDALLSLNKNKLLLTEFVTEEEYRKIYGVHVTLAYPQRIVYWFIID